MRRRAISSIYGKRWTCLFMAISMAILLTLCATPSAGAAGTSNDASCRVASLAGSPSICPRVPDKKPPKAPTNVEAGGLEVGVSITWSYDNREPDFAGFNIYVYRNGCKRPRKLNCYPIKDNFFYFKGGTAGDLFAVRSVDYHGNESGNPPVQVIPLPEEIFNFFHPTQNTNPEIEYSGNWLVTSDYIGTDGGRITIPNDDGTHVEAFFNGLWVFERPFNYDGQLIVCGSGGEFLEVTFYGRSVKLVSSRYWSCGMCQVYLDGQSRGVVNLQSEETQYGYAVLSDCSLRPGYHTIKLVNLGIPVTSFNAQYGLYFVNFDYLVVR